MNTPSKQDLRQSYDTTMKDMRSELTPLYRAWSYVIHAPVIAGIGFLLSEILLRPRSLAIGGVFAIISVAITTLISHLHNYTPSGAEIFIGFIAGWLCGILYDTISHLLSKK